MAKGKPSRRPLTGAEKQARAVRAAKKRARDERLKIGQSKNVSVARMRVTPEEEALFGTISIAFDQFQEEIIKAVMEDSDKRRRVILRADTRKMVQRKIAAVLNFQVARIFEEQYRVMQEHIKEMRRTRVVTLSTQEGELRNFKLVMAVWVKERSRQIADDLSGKIEQIGMDILRESRAARKAGIRPQVFLADEDVRISKGMNESRAAKIATTVMTEVEMRVALEVQRMIQGKIGEGFIVELIWRTSKIEGTCATCEELDGTPSAVWQAKFPNGVAHPNCRCRVVPKLIVAR